jgi:hypothetical protein
LNAGGLLERKPKKLHLFCIYFFHIRSTVPLVITEILIFFLSNHKYKNNNKGNFLILSNFKALKLKFLLQNLNFGEKKLIMEKFWIFFLDKKKKKGSKRHESSFRQAGFFFILKVRLFYSQN